jgi:molybdopterin molybdotransferase
VERIARIFTGAQIPDGADTVVPQELAEIVDGGQVRLASLARGSHIRPQGDIVAQGDLLGEVGDVVTPQHLSLLATAGVGAVDIFLAPRVALISTGAELIDVDATPRPGEVRDSNQTMLAALATQASLTISTRARVADSLPGTQKAIAQACDVSDIVVTSGGVSVGDHDHVARAITDLGGEILIHSVQMKPGKPILLARLRGRWIAGLPGNPVSALCGWRFFVQPLCERMAGAHGAFDEDGLRATLDNPVVNDDDRLLFLPARLFVVDGLARAATIAMRGSHDVAAIARANAFVMVDPRGKKAAGDIAQCFPLARPLA